MDDIYNYAPESIKSQYDNEKECIEAWIERHPELKNNNEFFLLNKDTCIAKFIVKGTGLLQIIEVTNEYVEVPEWLHPLSEFIISRQAHKGRENIEELLQLSGCNNLLGYIKITHALSLIDTYWVKPTNSALTWRDVSLYDKPFNEVIARTAFEGGLHGHQLSSTSPEYGTDGTFAKCWVRDDALEMFVLDAIIFNTDRHKGNFGFIIDNDTQRIIKPAPLFDHNLSLLCYALEEDFKSDVYLKKLGPRIGNKFIDDARACLTTSMRKRLINIKDFKFERHPKYNLPEWRLELLESLINKQIDLILQ